MSARGRPRRGLTPPSVLMFPTLSRRPSWPALSVSERAVVAPAPTKRSRMPLRQGPLDGAETGPCLSSGLSGGERAHIRKGNGDHATKQARIDGTGLRKRDQNAVGPADGKSADDRRLACDGPLVPRWTGRRGAPDPRLAADAWQSSSAAAAQGCHQRILRGCPGLRRGEDGSLWLDLGALAGAAGEHGALVWRALRRRPRSRGRRRVGRRSRRAG